MRVEFRGREREFVMLALQRIAAPHLVVLQEWYEDPEMRRRMSYPSEDWFRYVTQTENVKCWIVLLGDEIAAQIQVDDDGDVAYIDMAVRPALQGRGIGTQSMTAFLVSEGKNYSTIEARIEPDNVASLRCFRNAGFIIADEADSEGFLAATINARQVSTCGHGDIMADR